jgi:hypothetical protein
MAVYRMYHCMVQRMGYPNAPMGHLTLNGASADTEYQKSLDTFSKRHHLRLWKQGQEGAWLSAATEDVGYQVRRMHLTHGTDPLIDNERAKVLNDLVFTGCVEAATLMTRQPPEAAGQQKRSITTDGKIAIVRMNDCHQPVTMPGEGDQGRNWRPRPAQALVALRNDLIRANPVSFAFNTIRRLREHRDPRVNGFISPLRSGAGVTRRWARPSVLDVTAAGGKAGANAYSTRDAVCGHGEGLDAIRPLAAAFRDREQESRDMARAHYVELEAPAPKTGTVK